MLHLYGFKISGAHIGELGPGDSIGIGLAALLSGASWYVGLDVMPFSAKADLECVLTALAQMYSRRESIPDDSEFPLVRPILDSYRFPDHLVDWTDFDDRAASIHNELRGGLHNGQCVTYRAPWTSPDNIAAASLDLVFSQAVLEHVNGLEETYRAMFLWLKPGGYASHVIDFSAHGRSPFWNGHWAYSDLEWRLVCGSREFVLNREPLRMHLAYAKKVGFEVLALRQEYNSSGLEVGALSPRFQALDAADARTCGATLILRKPLVDEDKSLIVSVDPQQCPEGDKTQ
jgi:hypothetical protein